MLPTDTMLKLVIVSICGIEIYKRLSEGNKKESHYFKTDHYEQQRVVM